MAFNIGGFLGQVGQITGKLGGGQNPYVSSLSAGLNIAGALIPAKRAAAPTVAVPNIIVGAAGASRGLTKEITVAGSKILGRLGIRITSISAFSGTLKRTLSSIATLARRTPSGTMVSLLVGLGLTAMEAYTLTAWHAQRKKGRRMNPANSRALRRAARRIRSFHKLCQHTDLIKTRHTRKAPCR